MQRTRPPFRADEVGSLLRPAKIKEARAKLEKGEIAPADLRKIEDAEIDAIVTDQPARWADAEVYLVMAARAPAMRSW